MIGGVRPGKIAKPEVRAVEEGLWGNFSQNGIGDANVGDDDFTAPLPAGQQVMAGLGPEEGDGDGG